MQVRGAGATSVIVHRLPADRVERFLELERAITDAAATLPGYQGTDVYPPAAGHPDEWVVAIHFDKPEALERWLNSPVRSEWVARLRSEIGEFSLKTLPSGFGAWFAGLANGSDSAVLPPSWKIALTILLTLYPTVMLLAIFVGPRIQSVGLALSMLISNALSVSILQWAVQPALNPLLGRWLRANDKRQLTYSLAGLVAILALLGVMLAIFRLATG